MDKDDTVGSGNARDDLADQERALLEEHLEELRRAGFLERLSKDKCAFSNNLTWEVVYKSLMFSERRRFHSLVGRYLEQCENLRTEDILDLLLFHFEAAKEHPLTARYGVLAGDRAARLFANQEAISSYSRAKEALLALGEELPVDHSLLCEKTADVYQSFGDYEAALGDYLAAYDHWKAAGDDAEPKYIESRFEAAARSSELCRKMSVTHEYASDYDKAEEWITKAIGQIGKSPDEYSSRVYTSKSVIHFRKGELQDAVASGEEALRLAKNSGEAAAIAYSHTILANALQDSGKIRDAVGNLKKAVALYLDLQDYRGLASAYGNLGVCSFHLGQIDQAIEYYNKNIEVESKTQNKARLAVSYNNIAEVYLLRGDVDEAIRYLELIVDASARNEAPGGLAGYALMNLSRCFRHQGAMDKAEEAIDRSLELIRISGAHGVDTEARLFQTEIYLAQGRYAEADSLCRQTMDEIERQGARLLQARGSRILAKLAFQAGDTETAEAHIAESIKSAHKNGLKYEEALSTRTHAEILADKGSQAAVVLFELRVAADLFKKVGAEREYQITHKMIEEVSPD